MSSHEHGITRPPARWLAGLILAGAVGHVLAAEAAPPSSGPVLDARRLQALSLRQQPGGEAEGERELRQVIAARQQARPVDAKAAAEDLTTLVTIFLRPQQRLAEAETTLQQAIAWRRQAPDFHEADLLACWEALAGVHQDQGRAADAESILLRALQVAQAAPERVGPGQLIDLRLSLGVAQMVQGRLTPAEQNFRQALTDAERNPGPGGITLSLARTRLAEVLRFQRRYPETEKLLRAELAWRSARTQGEWHPDLWPTQSRLAGVLLDQDRPAEAEKLLRRLAEEHTRLHGSKHAKTAHAEAELSQALSRLGRATEAEHWLKQAIEHRSQAGGDTRTDMADLHNRLGAFYLDQGRFKDAVPPLRQSLQLTQARLGPTHPEVATVQANLALALHRLGQLDDAAALYRQALAAREARQPPVPAEVADLLESLGSVYSEQNDLPRAEDVLQRALVMRRRLAAGKPSAEVVSAQSALAGVLVLAGRLDQANALLRDAITSAEALRADDPYTLPNLLASQSGILRRRGDLAGAQRLLERALDLRRRGLGADAVPTAIVETALARVLTLSGQTATARTTLDHAIRVFERDPSSSDSPRMAVARQRMAEALRAEGRIEPARQEAAQALRLHERTYGPQHHDTVECRALVQELAAAR